MDPAPRIKASYSGVAHYLSESGHFLLGIKVLIGAGMIAGGFYFLFNTVPHGYRLKDQTFFVNTIIGILYVLLGSILVANSLFGYGG